MAPRAPPPPTSSSRCAFHKLQDMRARSQKLRGELHRRAIRQAENRTTRRRSTWRARSGASDRTLGVGEQLTQAVTAPPLSEPARRVDAFHGGGQPYHLWTEARLSWSTISALHRVWGITRRTRLMRSQRCQSGASASFIFPRPTHGEIYLWRLVQVAKNDSVGNPHKFIRTVRTLSAF